MFERGIPKAKPLTQQQIAEQEQIKKMLQERKLEAQQQRNQLDNSNFELKGTNQGSYDFKYKSRGQVDEEEDEDDQQPTDLQLNNKLDVINTRYDDQNAQGYQEEDGPMSLTIVTRDQPNQNLDHININDEDDDF